jgi:hypothetical protein
MSIQWIFDATHYDEPGKCFYKKVDDEWHVLCDDGDHFKSASLYNGETKESELIERPKQPQAWSGPEDGLPPVGTVCEARILLPGQSNYLWRRCEVVYQNEEMSQSELLVVDIEETAARWADEFRAIKTEEDIAAQLRESAIRELMDIAQVDCRVTAARLVDAGFKREACKSDCSTNNRGVPELLGACDCR